MERLGYDGYGVQGGDWGGGISRELGRIRPRARRRGTPESAPRRRGHRGADGRGAGAADPAERERTLASWRAVPGVGEERQGYADLQATRPQTLAYALNDSPVGQLAWIVEKFAEWTDPASVPEEGSTATRCSPT